MAIGFPYTLEAGETLSCTYSADLPNGDDRLNTVAVEQQNFSYDEDGEGTAGGTTDYNAEADVEFGIGADNCVEVYDDKTELTNTATVHLLEEATPLDQASWTVDVFVECPPCESETAWAANGNESGVFLYNPDGGGNWATYVQHAEKTVTLFAGQTQVASTVTFSAVDGGMLTINVNLAPGWTFEAGSVVAVQGYSSPLSGNPAPGQFADKEPASGSSHTIVVPAAA